MSDPHLVFARRVECEEDGLYFNRYFFKQRFGSKMLVEAFHNVIQSTLDKTMLPPNHPDFISRLVIDIPPGYTKTELASINYMARGIAVNPQSRFLHLSYSHKLALTNSNKTRSIVKSQKFQEMWRVGIKQDTDSKEIWHTDQEGGVTATAAGGQVTGFRAGHMDATKFSGALIIDDPVKPDDAYSEAIRKGVNNNYSETIASRVAVESVPIIVIMQRIHWDDLAGHLLRGGSGEKWHHLNLPVIIEDSDREYPDDYTHGIPIDHGLPNGWLWPIKHNDTHIIALKSHRRKYWAQYKQKPIKRDEESSLWKESLISKARELGYAEDLEHERRVVAVDPAVSDTATSDEHGIVVAGKVNEVRHDVLADLSRKGSPEQWASTAIKAYEDYECDAIIVETNNGGDMCISTLRNAGFKGKIKKITATRGKAKRAEPIAALYELSQVGHKAGLSDMEEEMLDFDQSTGLSGGKSPNRLDACVWALTELSGGVSYESLLDKAMGN